jgi:hypothetical protein
MYGPGSLGKWLPIWTFLVAFVNALSAQFVPSSFSDPREHEYFRSETFYSEYLRSEIRQGYLFLE